MNVNNMFMGQSLCTVQVRLFLVQGFFPVFLSNALQYANIWWFGYTNKLTFHFLAISAIFLWKNSFDLAFRSKREVYCWKLHRGCLTFAPGSAMTDKSLKPTGCHRKFKKAVWQAWPYGAITALSTHLIVTRWTQGTLHANGCHIHFAGVSLSLRNHNSCPHRHFFGAML